MKTPTPLVIETYKNLKELHSLVSLDEQVCIELYMTFIEEHYEWF